MRSGKLDRTITLQAFTSSVNDFGTPIETWVDVATMRAERVETGTEEFVRGMGSEAETQAVFRVRWRDGVTVANRIIFEGRAFNIKRVEEIGRRKGLLVGAEAVGET